MPRTELYFISNHSHCQGMLKDHAVMKAQQGEIEYDPDTKDPNYEELIELYCYDLTRRAASTPYYDRNCGEPLSTSAIMRNSWCHCKTNIALSKYGNLTLSLLMQKIWEKKFQPCMDGLKMDGSSIHITRSMVKEMIAYEWPREMGSKEERKSKLEKRKSEILKISEYIEELLDLDFLVFFGTF